jgi:hypothetical protein
MKFLKQKSLSMKALFYTADEPRDSISNDSDLAQMDPVLVVTSIPSKQLISSRRKYKLEANPLPNLDLSEREVLFSSTLLS